MRELMGLLALASVVRGAFLALMPEAAVSIDLSINWTTVAQLLERGENPYAASTYLNWPPLWMQLIYSLRRVSELTGLSWLHTVRGFTALLDVAGIGLAARLLGRGDNRAARALLWGWALNPSAVLLSCQHCNFDGLLVVFCILGVAALIAFSERGDAVDWLYACLCIGLGILTKTVPVMLVALLAGFCRRLDPKTRALGAIVTFGPAALGLSVIYVLAPAGVTANVMHYRSSPGWYGVTGLFALFGLVRLTPIYSALFQLMLGLAMLWLALRVWREQLSARHLTLAVAWLFLFVPTLGPGYGPQYVSWSLPFLVLASLDCSRSCARFIYAQLAVTALTLCIEYGLFPSHGAAWLRWPHPLWLRHLSRAAATQAGQTLVRLPGFIASVACLIALGRELLQRVRVRAL